MVILFVKFKSALPDDEVRRIMDERLPQFQNLPGLAQKYYAREAATGEWSGVYLWESREDLDRFLGSELFQTIPSAYRIEGRPRMEFLDVLFPLRPMDGDRPSIVDL